jgi:hypothetical protein
MFLNTDNFRPPRWEDPRPDPKPPILTKKQEKVMVLVILFNLLLMLVAPIGGASILSALAYFFP